ncbi:MAG: Gfo/Idh/MocA family protein [Phycisphaerales bacterium]|jgi:UDP-N-acetyl-2-amino-2-deoxyglucuronate dehydrogenase
MWHSDSVIEGRPIRAAVVGCGRISRNHFKVLDRVADRMELVAVCDVSPARFDAVPWDECPSLDRKTPRFGRIEEMLEEVRSDRLALDLAILASPSGLHASQTVACSSAGLHVMTEKPMATRWQDALDAVKACDRAGVRFFVVKQNRFNATLQLLKRAVDERRFGRIHMVNVNVFWQRPQSYYDTDRWRGTWELDGGAFMNQASHYVDLLDWLIGPIASVQAMTGTLGRSIEVEDSGVLNVRWRSGAMGSMNVSMLTWPRNLEGSITVLGETGSVRIGGVAVNEIQIWDFAEERDYDASIRDANYEVPNVYGLGHLPYYENVIDVLRGKAEPLTDGREGLKSLEVIIAAYLSARDGRTVSLPLHY